MVWLIDWFDLVEEGLFDWLVWFSLIETGLFFNLVEAGWFGRSSRQDEVEPSQQEPSSLNGGEQQVLLIFFKRKKYSPQRKACLISKFLCYY